MIKNFIISDQEIETQMKNNVRRTIAMLGAALMAAQFVTATPTNSPPVPGSSSSFEQAMPVTQAQKEVDRLLKEIARNAAITAEHAGRVDSFARLNPNLATSTHADELNRVKAAINAMGADYRKLQELQAAALPWQQAVIDRMGPALAGMAGNTTKAIQQLKADRGIRSDEYRAAVGSLQADAGQVRTLVAVNLNYAQAREKLNRLDGDFDEAAANVTPAPAPTTRAAVKVKAPKTLEERVQSELLRLPYYGAFDILTFEVDGSHVELSGAVTRPTLKSDAEAVVRGIEGVTSVTSSIKVLPLSPNDDSIRRAAYRAIYGQPTLALYRLNPHPPIRIIVENGHVTLEGAVANEMDRTIANMKANSVPGAFSVTDNLQVD